MREIGETSVWAYLFSIFTLIYSATDRLIVNDMSDGNFQIQGPKGTPGPIVNLQSPADAGALNYGMVKPVTQRGASELGADLLTKEADGSLTLWFGRRLPGGAPAANRIPTPVRLDLFIHAA